MMMAQPAHEGRQAMTQSSPILELPMADSAAMDEAEIARVLEEASQIVEGFSQQASADALDRVLSLGGHEGSLAAAEAAGAIAREVSAKTGVLENEIERFVALRRDG